MELVLEHLNKSFKNKKAVIDVNITLHEGVHGLLGANGSGKNDPHAYYLRFDSQ